MESVLFAQQKQDEYIKQLASKVDTLSTDNKMLEAQMTLQASSSSRSLGRLLSKPETDPHEHCNCVILTSGLEA